MRKVQAVAATAAISSLMAVALALPATSSAKPTADYRFEGNLKSSVNGVPNLNTVGPSTDLKKAQVKGSRQGVFAWPEGSGLRLNQAHRAVGSGAGTYTFVMLVRLDNVDSYRKLIHFGGLNEDDGFYVDDGTLYAYPRDYSADVIEANHWYQLAETRNAEGKVHAFIDGKRVLSVGDPNHTQVMGANDLLRFVIDDEGTQTEESGGQMARLRIYDEALTDKQVHQLGK